MRYLVLDGKAYSWKQILELRKAQREAAKKESQPTLFPLIVDCRPPSQTTVAGRYSEPTLFDL